MNRQEFIIRWPNFKPEEFMCHCGKCGPGTGLLMKATNLDKLQALRSDCGFPFSISSGYRCPKHPAEKKKKEPGAHGHGQGEDIIVAGENALILVTKAHQHGFTGIGVSQRGRARFVHLDDMDNQPSRPRPWIWSY
jgi:zinc D-Ala-D-Ala carboxypeptidase